MWNRQRGAANKSMIKRDDTTLCIGAWVGDFSGLDSLLERTYELRVAQFFPYYERDSCRFKSDLNAAEVVTMCCTYVYCLASWVISAAVSMKFVLFNYKFKVDPIAYAYF